MNKRDALRLVHGQTIVFGGSGRTALIGAWRKGVVEHVTPRGGIRVRLVGYRRPEGGPAFEWVPYHHVHQGLSR